MNPSLRVITLCSGPLRALPVGLAVDGDALTITYAIELDASYTATPGAFAVTVDGGPLAVVAVNVSGAAVLLTLGSPVVAGQVVAVGYVPGADGIRSTSGVLVAGFAARAVDSGG